MNKNFLLTFSCLLGITSVKAQMPKWVLPPYLIEFPSSGNPAIASYSLNYNANSYHGISNGAFDKNGNLLFYMDSDKIYDINGNLILNQNLYDDATIIPVPGLCNRYYIIYFNQTGLHYSMVEVHSNGNANIVSNYNNIELAQAGYNGSIAVSKLKLGKTRFLFTVGCNDVRRFKITSYGISYETTISSQIGYSCPGEAELFENPATGNMQLAFGKQGTTSLYVLKMDNMGNLTSTQNIYFTGTFITGLEFFDSGNKLLAATGYGIAKIDLTNSTVNVIPNTTGYISGNIEKAVNGKFYTIYQSSLAEINLNTLTVNHVLNLQNFPPYSVNNLLPRQIDDEDYSATNFNAELIIRDNGNDIGMEPNMEGIATNNIWASPDLWNRRNQSGDPLTHQEPGYSASDLNNLMKVRITNVGCSYSNPSYVKMYWTLGNTGERWPESWTGTDQINGVSIGSEIQTSSSYSTYTPNGYPVPALAPGADAVIEATWHPPVPAMYNSTAVTNDAMICFLARIDDPNEPMYNERPGPLAPVKKNILDNNNIVTRNTSLMNLPGAFARKTRSIIISNPLVQADFFDIKLSGMTGTEINFVATGTIEMTLDPSLWEAWMQSGFNFSGTATINQEQHSLTISDPTAFSLTRIKLPPGKCFGLSLSFEQTQPTYSIEEYQFLVTQGRSAIPEDDESATACQFIVSTNTKDDEGDDVGFMAQHSGNKLPADATHAGFSLMVNPNPSDKYTELTMDLGKDEQVQLTLVNMEGKQMQLPTENSTYTKGKHNLRINTEKLPAGMYILSCKTASGMQQALKIEVKH